MSIPNQMKKLRLFRRVGWLALAFFPSCGDEPAEGPGSQGASPTREAAAAPSESVAEHLSPRPGYNILFISFDALRADALGCYGYPRSVSPNIDAFAEQALLCEQAYSISPVTATSFAGAWTGRLPTDVFHNWKVDEVPTLALAFQEQGYQTTAILNNAQLSPVRRYDRGFDSYVWHLQSEDEVILEIAQQWASRPLTKPFFTWIHFLSPHTPYDWRAESANLYDADYRGRFEKGTGDTFTVENAEDSKRVRDLYDGEIRHVDALFGRLIAALEASNLLKNTIIFVTADHGDEFGERGIYQHRHLYEETVRIPLIIRHPDHLQARRSSKLISNLDFFPTSLALIGKRPPCYLEGIDLTTHRGSRGDVFGIAMTDDIYRGVSVRRGHYKLILDLKPTFAEHLFDLRSDRKEIVDLAPQQQELVKLLSEMAWVHVGEMGVVHMAKWTDATAGLSAETIEALRSLGY